jgi:hypothetical protein
MNLRHRIAKPGASGKSFSKKSPSAVAGQQRWNLTWNQGLALTNWSQSVYAGNGARYENTVAADGSTTFSAYQNGRLISATRWDAQGFQLAAVTYGYDAHGRANTVTDVRNGISTTTFNNADQPVATLTPSPDGVQSGQLTTNILDSMGRIM